MCSTPLRPTPQPPSKPRGETKMCLSRPPLAEFFSKKIHATAILGSWPCLNFSAKIEKGFIVVLCYSPRWRGVDVGGLAGWLQAPCLLLVSGGNIIKDAKYKHTLRVVSCYQKTNFFFSPLHTLTRNTVISLKLIIKE